MAQGSGPLATDGPGRGPVRRLLGSRHILPGLVGAAMLLPSGAFFLASHAAGDRADLAQRAAVEARGEAEAARLQTDTLTDLLREQQRITACRSGLARTVDLAVLQYLAGTFEPGDQTAVRQALADAIVARAATETTCQG